MPQDRQRVSLVCGPQELGKSEQVNTIERMEDHLVGHTWGFYHRNRHTNTQYKLRDRYASEETRDDPILHCEGIHPVTERRR